MPESGVGIWEKIGNISVDISGKLDKPTTPTAKSVVSIDTDGTSGTVAESDFTVLGSFCDAENISVLYEICSAMH